MDGSVGQPLPSVSGNPALHHPPSILTGVASDFDLTWQVCEGAREFLAFAEIYQELDRESVRPCQSVHRVSLSWSLLVGGPLRFLPGQQDLQAAVDWLIRKWNPASSTFLLKPGCGGFKFCLDSLEIVRRGNKVLLKLLIKNGEDATEERKRTFISYTLCCRRRAGTHTHCFLSFVHHHGWGSGQPTKRERAL